MIKIKITTPEICLECSDEQIVWSDGTSLHHLPDLITAVQSMITYAMEATNKIIAERKKES